ncbi:putative phosphatidate cytidylyltransferase [Cladophialophora carrionii]|uniref:dolichol kinase n=1 Tax=Cladophialophora carrionii TaxID=86049 RepID=A0A1C1CC47_9EURO|nr:putative phosphatidate cytidylyltransferase [Cladophialophora carrionii]
MTFLKPTRTDSGRSSSQEIHEQPNLRLSRTPRPYHLRGDSLSTTQSWSGAGGSTSVADGFVPSPRPSRSESSDSGTEADDEKGPFLKGLPAPALRLHKGLRGSTPANLTPAASPPSTPPAFVDGEEPRFFEQPEKREKKLQASRSQVRDYQTYKDRKRREIVRRCTETSLLCGIGVIVWNDRKASTGLQDWLNEIAAFLVIPPLVYLVYPLRLTFLALASGKTLTQSLRLGFHIPSRFDPGPLLYPVLLPSMVAVSLFHHSASFLPATIVSGLSSMPRLVTTTQFPAIGEYLHWVFSVLPLHASNHQVFTTSVFKPLSLKIGPSLTREDLVLLFPLHHVLMSVLGYLTTSSLETSELQLLSSALVSLYLFAGTPQAEILKAMIWLGGLCIFITCKHVLMWEVALARVPTWRLLKIRRNRGLVSQIDQAICTFLVRGTFRHVSREDSDSDDDVQPMKSIRKLRPRLKLQLNGRALSAMGPVEEAKSALEATATNAMSLDTATIAPPLRRNTFAAFDHGNSKQDSVTMKKAKAVPSGLSAPFLAFSLEQVRVRKYAYAAAAYFLVAATILGPVRLYVATRALSNQEPIGWALGYLLGNLPAVRFWVVSNNLERWISLPARQRVPAVAFENGLVEHLRQNVLGPATTRLAICAYCLVVLGTGIAAVLRLTSVVEVDTRRKVFHGIMVAMLLPTIYMDPCFIALALSLILAIFLLLDLFRASQLPPISKPLTVFLAPYVDGRDHRGPVIVSHIFLLIGCAIPLWLSLAAAPRVGDAPWNGWDTPVRDLSMVSGVICVGMGDAAASLIGRRYGKTKWYWVGGKSLEGSLAFAIAVTCGLLTSWAWLRLGGWMSWHDGKALGSVLGKCLVAGTGASLLESTLTAANDNVVVPVGLWLLVRGLDI